MGRWKNIYNYEICNQKSIAESLDGFDACGCGSQVALGALCVTEDMKPEQRIISVLQAAERYNTGVRSPFNIVNI